MAHEASADPLGVTFDPAPSPFDYSAGNRQMMKEYGMTEAEWEYEFGGRPHQQRQSSVSRSDLTRLRIPLMGWDYCSHKYIPWYYCYVSNGSYYSGSRGCGHQFHEYELCVAADAVRRNQVLQRKRAHHAMYAIADKNWLYNDPNWGHMFWRSKYSVKSLKGRFSMGGGTRVCFYSLKPLVSFIRNEQQSATIQNRLWIHQDTKSETLITRNTTPMLSEQTTILFGG